MEMKKEKVDEISALNAVDAKIDAPKNAPVDTPVNTVEKDISFDDSVKLGPGLTKRYENGNLPLLHKTFYKNIVEALNGEKEGILKITEIREKMGVATNSIPTMLAALNKYGYIEHDKKYPKIKGTYIRLTGKHID